jgi:putative sporulation protein YtxC
VESIRIGTNLPKDKISEIINSNSFSSKVKMKSESFDNSEFFIFDIDKYRLEEVSLFNNLAKLIQNIINKLYMKEIIEDKVSAILQDFVQSDIDEVGNTVYDLLLDENYFEDDKSRIEKEIKDYLLENNTLILDGYIRFRSRSFEDLVDKIIEKVILDIQMESEYEDFIEMLQYYLETQLPKVDTVNVIIRNNEFYLLDNKQRPIESTSIKSIIEEYEINDISKADVLVSTLIVLAPNKVVIHIKNDNEKELMQILKKIFTKRLTFCYSCEICDIPTIKEDNE